MTTLGKTAFEIQSILKPIAAMVVKELRPKDDVLSMNKVYDLFPRRWVDQQIREGNLHRKRYNSHWSVSRADIECLWAAANATPSIQTED